VSRYSEIVAAWNAGPDEGERKMGKKQQDAALVRRLINEFAAYIEWPEKLIMSKPGPKGEYVGAPAPKNEDAIDVGPDGSLSCFIALKMPHVAGDLPGIHRGPQLPVNVLMVGEVARVTIFDEYEIHDPSDARAWDTLWEKTFIKVKALCYATRPARI